MSSTPDQMLDVLRRTCAEDWLAPLLADPDSLAVLTALATVASRLSVESDAVCASGLISEAPPGVPGVTTVSVTRNITGVNTIVAGTLFEDARGVLYTTDVDIPLPPGAFALTSFSLRTLRETESVDTVDDPDIRPSPVFIVGDATNASPIVITTTTKHTFLNGDRVQVRDAEGNDAANGLWTVAAKTDFTFQLATSTGNGIYTLGGIVFPDSWNLLVVESTPTAGGASNWLGALGAERGVVRTDGETDGDYRARVRNIVDAVAPQGILEAVNGVAQGAGLPQILMLEPFAQHATPDLLTELGLGSLANLFLADGSVGGFPGSSQVVGTSGAPLPYALDEMISLMLGIREARAYFELVTATVPAPISALPYSWHADVHGGHYEIGIVTTTVIPFVGTFYVNTNLIPGIAAIWDEADRRRAGGVQFDLAIAVAREFYAQAAAVPPSTGVWTVTPPGGKIWLLEEMIVGHVKQQVGVLPADRSHVIRFTFEDATTYDTPAYFGFDAERISEARIVAAVGSFKRITSIRGSLGGTAGVSFNLIAYIRVIEVPV